MKLEYTGRGTTVTPKLKALADAELARIAQMVPRLVSAHVILTEDKYRKIAEVTLTAASESLVAVCEGTEMATVLHDALRKVEAQAMKHKERKLTIERQAKPDSEQPSMDVGTPALGA